MSAFIIGFSEVSFIAIEKSEIKIFLNDSADFSVVIR